MKLLLSFPVFSSLPVTVVRLSGFPVALLFLGTFSSSISALKLQSVTALHGAPSAIPFWPAWFLLH